MVAELLMRILKHQPLSRGGIPLLIENQQERIANDTKYF